MKTFRGDRLRATRKALHLRSADIAEALGVTRQQVSAWETGRYEPNLASLWSLADYLDVTSDFLIGLDERNVNLS